MFKKSVAVRDNVKLKIGLAGPSGSGKTYSALQLAYGMTGDWSKVALADTENKSGKYYAHLGPWQHIPFDPEEFPQQTYHPDNWVKLIKFVEQDPTIDVLVLDSISHEWEGKGGCLDVIDGLNKGFAGWKVVTPLHNRFMDALRNSRLHIIATMRTKQDYVVETNDRGKATPKKVGLKTNQREGTDYEFGVVFDIEINHHASSSKDRTGLFAERREFKLTPAIGKELMDWANGGQPVAEKPKWTGPALESNKDPGEFDPENGEHKEWLRGWLVSLKLEERWWGAAKKRMAGKKMLPNIAKNVIAAVKREAEAPPPQVDIVSGVFES